MSTPTAFSVSSLRRAASPLGILALTLSLAACGSAPTPAATVGSAPADFVYNGTDTSWSAQGTTTGGAIVPLALSDGDNLLSTETWTAASNGYGPIEINKSNGGKNAGDGKTLTLNGKTYASGFGTNANSSMTFDIGGKCATFTADVGVDDEVGSQGSVTFQVFADGAKLFDSGLLTGASATKSLSVNIAGKNELRLVVTDGGDGGAYDHADWVNPTLLACASASVVPSEPGSVHYVGPTVITKGGTYSGNWQSFDRAVPAVTIKTSEPVIIENSNIRGRGNLISGYYNRLTVHNVRGYAMNPNVLGRTAGRGVNAEDNLSLRVENSYFEGTTGIYVRAFHGDPSKGETIKVLRNSFKNIDGRRSDGNEGYTGEYNIEHALTFNMVQHVKDVEIAWNQVINEPDKSRVEENMITYKSSGTADSPIRFHDNYIQGGYPLSPATNTNYAGGGILLGDGKVTNPEDNGHARVYDNQIVGTTNQGLALAGGVDNQIYNNRVIGSGRLPDGTRIPTTNVGIYVWDYNKMGGLTPPLFANNVMRDNVVGWTKVLSDGTERSSAMWLPACGLNSTVCSNNENIGLITLDMERQEYQRWQDKLAAANVKVGP